MRALLALVCVALPISGALVVACSSDSGGGTSDTPEAGPDSTVRDDGSTGDDGSTIRDAGRDVLPLGDAEGNCSALTGECDIVAQNCPPGNNGPQECAVVRGADGGPTTGCVDTRASQRLPKGHTCCPNAAGGDPCLPGLECIGDDCLGDASPTARCTPHCCSGSNGACGVSDPEGFAGQCDLGIDLPGVKTAFNVCSYTGQCKFLGQQPCPSGFTCLPQDKFGAARCYPVYNPDGGSGAQEMQPCTAANSCADGLLCVGPADGGSVCRMLCLVPLTAPPFDAGALEGGALHGGCSAGRSCSITFNPNSLPAWLGACAAPDGG